MLGLGLLLSALVLGGERVRITKRTDEKSDREDGCVLPSYIYLVVKKFLENGVLPRVLTVTTLRTCDGDHRLDIEISTPSLDRFTNKHIHTLLSAHTLINSTKCLWKSSSTETYSVHGVSSRRGLSKAPWSAIKHFTPR